MAFAAVLAAGTALVPGMATGLVALSPIGAVGNAASPGNADAVAVFAAILAAGTGGTPPAAVGGATFGAVNSGSTAGTQALATASAAVGVIFGSGFAGVALAAIAVADVSPVIAAGYGRAPPTADVSAAFAAIQPTGSAAPVDARAYPLFGVMQAVGGADSAVVATQFACPLIMLSGSVELDDVYPVEVAPELTTVVNVPDTWPVAGV